MRVIFLAFETKLNFGKGGFLGGSVYCSIGCDDSNFFVRISFECELTLAMLLLIHLDIIGFDLRLRNKHFLVSSFALFFKLV